MSEYVRADPNDASTWAVNRYSLTIPGQEAEAYLNDDSVRVVILIGGNRARKSTNMLHIMTKAMTGAYKWAPEHAPGLDPGVNALLVSKAFQVAGTSLQPPIERFMLYGLPSTLIGRRTTRSEVTTPIRLRNGSRFDLKTEAMGWHNLQGGGFNISGIDEFPEPLPWKELSARARSGVPYKRMVGYAPTDGPDGWFTKHVVEPTRRGERPNTRVINCAIFTNGDPVKGEYRCTHCGLSPKEWDAKLKTLGLRREFKYHWELKKLCYRCHSFGIEQAIDETVIEDFETEFQGNDLGIRLYGEFLAVRGTRCLSPAEIQVLTTGCLNGEARGGIKTWPRNHQEPTSVGVDAAEGLGPDHSETAAFAISEVTGMQVGLYASDDAPFHDYRETIDWFVTNPCGMQIGRERVSGLVVIERKSMGTALIEEYKQRPHIQQYKQRNPHERTHVSGNVWGWVSHDMARDTLLRNFFAAVQRNIVYENNQPVRMKTEPDPLGVWIRDRKTVEQLKHAYYDPDRGNRIRWPQGRRSDRVIAGALAHEGRLHRQVSAWKDPDPVSPYQAWLAAHIARRTETPVAPVEFREENGKLVLPPWPD